MTQVFYLVRATMLMLIFASLWSKTLHGVETKEDEIKYAEIEWIALMPSDDLEALLNPPSYFDEIEEGSRLDSLDMMLTGDTDDPRSARYRQALSSTRIIEDFNNQRIRIPGFIVPLVSDEKQNISEFFIVPYFGACLHFPPPPPNQILHVKTDKKVRLNNLQDAFWFEGQIKIEITNNLLGKAAYSLRLEGISPYDD
ncbi:hypothetical protein BAE46_06645 [Glaciecola punicea]|jgi:hypothetical protein|uniref:DUF3299 domain-containing protein n=1 Tax=Glaciecola punicea TaxID=56804 RepID=UPI0008730980|nr:DUF3299 domain-containing protein [Glaciecola punicea]OFA32116.1 hypothetical protein BAE46_06645 [Glaciecola punicea]